MIPGLQQDLFEHFFKTCLSPWDSAALMSSSGELLSLRYENLSDVGTLPRAGKIVQQYLKVAPGDLVILNDPFSGGNLLSNMTLVYGMESTCTGLVLIVRTGFRAKLHLGEKLDEEGLRIPPTPLAQKGQWLDPLLQALISHPQAPTGLEQRLRKLFQQMQKLSQHLSPPPLTWADHLRTSQKSFVQFLAEIPNGEAKAEHRLESGEIIRLRMEVQSSAVLFDFSGTSPSKKLGLSDAAVHGACLAALLAYFRQDLSINESLFSSIQVISPLGSMLNSKYPTATFRGMTEGVHRVAHTVWLALSKLASQIQMATTSPAPTWVGFEFEHGQQFFDSLPSGVGAHSKSQGSAAMHLWVRSPIVNSIEQIEARFPLRILEAGPRLGSGGAGGQKGGDGLIKTYQLLAPAKLKWTQSTSSILGERGGEPGLNSKIVITQKEKSENLLSESGEINLLTGAQIQVCTGGGGGYGKIRPPA